VFLYGKRRLNKKNFKKILQCHGTLKKLGPQYELKIQRKTITYVKNDESILNTMIIVVKFIGKCETLSSDESFQNICFGYVFKKHVNMLQLMKKL
jgi:hypothetical protein